MIYGKFQGSILISLVIIQITFIKNDPLPGCQIFDDEKCQSQDQYHANQDVSKRRWQTYKKDHEKYQKSYQDYHSLVGYADITYKNKDRNEARVCIFLTHKLKNSVTFEYFFNNFQQSCNCKIFNSIYKSSLKLYVKASDNTTLTIDPIVFSWNNKKLPARNGDFRNGKKGAIVELFGWKHTDVKRECELISKSGYLGVKLSPVHEHLMSTEPESKSINPWYYIYQPISFKFNSRSGTRQDFTSLVNTCRSFGLRVYVDVILNHFTGKGNDLNDHRDFSPNCPMWNNKSSSAPLDQQSPFFTHGFTYKLNPNTGQPPSQEFPGAAMGPEDFHCERALNTWNDLFILNNGWLVGLTDLDTSKENVRERLSSYLAELLSLGVTGFRIDAAKHMSPEDLSAIFKKLQYKMGGTFPEDFLVWLEILTGGEGDLIWDGPSWYGHKFNTILLQDLGSETEIEKIKIFDGLYPSRAWDNRALSRNRIVIQNDDHDSQMPGFSRDFGQNGCVLVKNCSIDQHKYFEKRLFQEPYGVVNNKDDWPIRIVLSSYYLTHGTYGVPDGLSNCEQCLDKCVECIESVPYIPAYVPGECGYEGKGYTKVHRDISIINAMRKWMNLDEVSGSDIGLPNCK